MKRPSFRLGWMRHWPQVVADREALREHLAGEWINVPSTYGVDAFDAAWRALDALLDEPHREVDDKIIFPGGIILRRDEDPRVNDQGLRRLRDLIVDMVAREHSELAAHALRVTDDPLTLEAFLNAAFAAPTQRALAEGIVASIQVLWRDLQPVARPWLIASALEVELAEAEMPAKTAQRLSRARGLVIQRSPLDLRSPLHALKRCENWSDTDARQIWRVASKRLGSEVSGLFEAMLSAERRGLGLQPRGVFQTTQHRSEFNQIVTLASEPSETVKVFVVHGAPGTGRSALGCAVASALSKSMEPVWITFERGPLEGWTDVAWATKAVLPGGSWDGPPPWLDLLFEVLTEAPKLYLVEVADAVPVAELSRWLPDSDVIVLLSERSLRALQMPNVQRVDLGRWTNQSAEATRWPVSALADYGSLPRDVLVSVDVAAVEDAERSRLVVAQPSGRLRLAGQADPQAKTADGLWNLLWRFLAAQSWPPRDSDLMTAAQMTMDLIAHDDAHSLSSLALNLLNKATACAPAWMPGREACEALMTVCDALWDEELDGPETNRLRFAEAMLCNTVGQRRATHLLDDMVTEPEGSRDLYAVFVWGLVSSSNDARAAARALEAYSKSSPIVRAYSAILDGDDLEAARIFEEVRKHSDLSDRAALPWLHWMIHALQRLGWWSQLTSLTTELLRIYPHASHLSEISFYAEARIAKNDLNYEHLDRLARANPAQAFLAAGQHLSDEYLDRWAIPLIRQFDASRLNGADRRNVDLALWHLGTRRPELGPEMGHRLLALPWVRSPRTDADAKLRRDALEMLGAQATLEEAD